MIGRLSLLLLLKVFLMIFVILYAGIGLGPDEAQYWTWSQALDGGYYSKPPGIAWQIWLGTQLFGQTEWGVRSVSVLFAFFQALAVYQLALYTRATRRTAFWCGLLMAFCPLGMAGSLFAITDGGLLLCWTGACLTLASALDKKEAPHPLYFGAWIMAGALFKWPIYLLWPFFFLCRRGYFPHSRKLPLLGGVLVSLLGLLPSVWWNASHHWATFRHVFATLQGGSEQRALGNAGEFFASQALLLSPPLFILLLCGLWQGFRQRNELPPSLFFSGCVTLATLSAAIIASFFQKIQGNWISFAYPTGMVIIGWEAFQNHPTRAFWAKTGLGISVILTCLFFLLPSFYASHPLPFSPLPYQLNPLKHNLGWPILHEALIRQGYEPKKDFLLSDKYQTTSLLSFYGSAQKRAYFLNLQGVRKNQFSYWPSLQEEQQGKTGYFVWVENVPHLTHHWLTQLNAYQTTLQRYFEEVQFLEFTPLMYEGPLIAKGALIFRCRSCKKEIIPADSNLY